MVQRSDFEKENFYKVIKGGENEIIYGTTNGELKSHNLKDGSIQDLMPKSEDFLASPGIGTECATHFRSSYSDGTYLFSDPNEPKVQRIKISEQVLFLLQTDCQSGYFLSPHAIFQYNFQSGKILEMVRYPEQNKAITSAKAVETNDGDLIVALNDRIYRFNGHRKQWRYEYVGKEGKSFVDGDRIFQVFVDSYGVLYCLFERSGLLRIVGKAPLIFLPSRLMGSRTISPSKYW